MKKKVFGRKLSRSRPTREALFASLAQALIQNGKIETTRAKAKAVVPSVEKMVTLARKGGVSARRNVLAQLDNSGRETDILFSSVAKAFLNKNSGFTRIISLPRRKGDNAEMVRLEWTEKIEVEDKQSLANQIPNKKKKEKNDEPKDKKIEKTKKDSSLKSSNPKS